MRSRPETDRKRPGVLLATMMCFVSVSGPVAAQDGMTPEEMATATTLGEAVQVMGNLRALPGGCPAADQGLVELSGLLNSAGIPAPDDVVLDGWGNPVLAWCDSGDWAVFSRGADRTLAAAYESLPDVALWGDDFVLFGDDRAYLPPHIETLMQAGKQKRTMADMRSIGITLEAYRIDNEALPNDPTSGFAPAEMLQDFVQPIYIRYLPLTDGWGNPIWVWIENGQYRIVSAGRDGILQHDYSMVAGAGATTSFDSDIVFGDGQFRQFPEGEQSP